jgi:[protein-PII] uridylyltransferase
MPERYFQTKTPEGIAEHLRLFRCFLEDGMRTPDQHLHPAVTWIDHEEAGHAEVVVCGWDRDRLLERISAALLDSGLNVLGADVFTRDDQLALDVFKVAKHPSDPLPSKRDRGNFQQRLEALLQASGGKTVPEPKFRRSRKENAQEEELPFWVSIDNVAHPSCTILEVQAHDRLGLLYHLLRAISYGGISIEAARITTERKAALDVFYIRGKGGEKITSRPQLLRLERRLRTAAARADAPR